MMRLSGERSLLKPELVKIGRIKHKNDCAQVIKCKNYKILLYTYMK